MNDPAPAAVQEAAKGYLNDDEMIVSWCLTMDVVAADGTRYLAHRAGGGAEGQDGPMIWAALGMLRASTQVAERQLAEATRDP